MVRSVANLLGVLGALVLARCGGGGGSSEPQLCQAYGTSPACPSGATCGCVGADPGCDCAACQAYGACHKAPAGSLLARSSTCVAQSDDDCRRPNGACEVLGSCHAETQVFGSCLAVNAADCRSSRLCTELGNCSFDGYGHCVTATDADCADSLLCKGFGCCHSLLGWCLGTGDTCVIDCPGASGCRFSKMVQESMVVMSMSVGDCSSSN
jgi:hypothetical protein